MKEDILYISQRIASVRSIHGISQSDLAYDAGISRNALNDIESGKSIPKISTVINICDAMKIPLDDIMPSRLLMHTLSPSTSRWVRDVLKAMREVNLADVENLLTRLG